MKRHGHLKASIFVFSLGILLLVCGISYADEDKEINNVVFGALHPHQYEIMVWISSGEIDGVSYQNIGAHLSLTNPAFNLIYATILTAKILNKPARVDVTIDSSDNKKIRGVVLW